MEPWKSIKTEWYKQKRKETTIWIDYRQAFFSKYKES